MIKASLQKFSKNAASKGFAFTSKPIITPNKTTYMFSTQKKIEEKQEEPLLQDMNTFKDFEIDQDLHSNIFV